eukprot:g49369.t1
MVLSGPEVRTPHSSLTTSVVFLLFPDGRLASADWDKKDLVRELSQLLVRELSQLLVRDSAAPDTTTPRESQQTLPLLSGHSSQITSVVFLPDGRLASADWDKKVLVQDLSSEHFLPEAQDFKCSGYLSHRPEATGVCFQASCLREAGESRQGRNAIPTVLHPRLNRMGHRHCAVARVCGLLHEGVF